MLRLLSISDFAIIDQLDVELGPGLNVLTGEAGAGKSIIVDALGLVTGARADATHVRADAERARVEAVFDLDEEARRSVAAIIGHDPEPGSITAPGIVPTPNIILSREIGGGRGVCRVDGRIVPLSLLQELGRVLCDIHGQGHAASLLRVREHIDLLDRYAGLGPLRDRMAKGVRELAAVQDRIARTGERERELARRADLLAYQAEEIRAAALGPTEEEALVLRRDRLASASRLAELAEKAHRLLAESAGEEALRSAAAAIARIAELDPSQRELRETADSVLFAAEELGRSVRDFAGTIEQDPAALQAAEERLGLISDLKRKYGDTVADVLAFGERAAADLSDLGGSRERVDELKAAEQDIKAGLEGVARELSVARGEAAGRLTDAVEAELAELAMDDARVRVSLRKTESEDGLCLVDAGPRYAFDSTGVDRVEFLLAANPGEPLRPLAKVASGGEASRLMLALRVALIGDGPVRTLVFDEIDAGVGGRVGEVVGRKMLAVAGRAQVLCVTHLPQIASFADRHLRVSKSGSGGRTVATVETLEGTRRLDELSAMIGASDAETRGAARVMMERAGSAR